MPAQSQPAIRNNLLRAMPPSLLDRIRPHLDPADLPLRTVLVEADEPTLDVWFIESGLASLVAVGSDDENIEVGHVGWEGMSGTHILLGADRSPNRTFMQVAGSGLRLPVVQLQILLDSEPVLRALLLLYVHSYEIQLSHSALANGRYAMKQRLARWLLMCHDRLLGDDLPLTHEFLSIMLGVRRSGVTNEIHILEGLGIIKATRGQIRVLDRAGLEDLAGGCYGLPEREYERLFGISHRTDGLPLAV